MEQVLLQNFIINEKNNTKINSDYLKHHLHITPRLRKCIIEWLYDFHLLEKCHFETFCLTINLIDRYLVKHPETTLIEFMKISIVCLHLASKFIEIYFYDFKIILKYVQRYFDINDLIKLEGIIFSELDFSLNEITIYHYLEINIKKDKLPLIIRQCTFDIMKNTKYLDYLPSIISSVILYVNSYNIISIYPDKELEEIKNIFYNDEII